MIQYFYLGRVDYDEGLHLQAEVAGLVAEGRAGNVLLLLEHPPVLTLGRNAKRANILASEELLKRRGVTVHEINRGGDVTYHGPGQLVGYPIFDLHTLRTTSGGRMGPVDFVRGMEEALIRVCGGFGVQAGRICGLTGVWCGTAGNSHPSEQSSLAGDPGREKGTGNRGPAETERKIGAIGIHVARGITSHGFAFNVTTDLRDFELIVPCGIPDHAVTSLAREVRNPEELPALEELAHRAAREFGQVFGEQVQEVESLAALRAQAAADPDEFPAQFPAEDTPLRVPDEVKRLQGEGEGPIRT
jgi:lipoyl(octanoyl) transferase